MAGKVNRRFTVDLEISMGDAEKKIKGTVGNIKTILADLGKASDKMNYFKELADYLSQVDAELDRFKQKHGDGLFNQIFSGLDAGLRKEMEDVFGTAREQLAQLESIRARFDKLKSVGATAEGLKPLEQELKDLYKTLGKLDEANISGRGSLEKRLQNMESALNNFAIVWDGVNDKISQGINIGVAASGSNTNAGSAVSGVHQLSNEVQKEVDLLNKQIEELKDAKNKLLKIYDTVDKVVNKAKGADAISDDYLPELNVDSIKQLVNEFNELKSILDSSDKSSVEYYTNLLKTSEMALKIYKANAGIKADSALKQALESAKFNQQFSIAWGNAGNVLNEVLGLKTLKSKTIKPLDNIIKSLLAEIESAKSEISNNSPIVSDEIIGDVNLIRKKIGELEEQLVRLGQIKESLEIIKKDIKDSNDDVTLFDDVYKQHTATSVKQLINDFRKAEKAKKDFENAGDTSSSAYYDNITSMSKAGLELKKIYESMDDTFEESLDSVKSGSGTLFDSLENAMIDINRFFDKSFNSVFGNIDKLVNTSTAQLKNLQSQLETTMEHDVSGSGAAVNTGSGGTITNVDFTDLKETIKSEASALANKLDNILKVELVKDDTDIHGAINNIQTTVDKISGVIDNYNALKENNSKQAEVDLMKANLTQLLNFITKHNSNKTEQELKAILMSDKTISIGYGEEGKVSADTKLQTALSNLTSSIIADIHSHPISHNGRLSYMNDMFSGSSGDLGATRFAQQLGAKITSMITGNIMRTFDLTKLTPSQLSKFVGELSSAEKRYMKDTKYSQYVSSTHGELRRYNSPSLEHAHKTTEVFEQMMYDAFNAIGISKDKVNSDIFHKFNLSDNEQLTQAATYLVDMANSAHKAISPLERLKDILQSLGTDVNSGTAKTLFAAFDKGEISAAKLFNSLNPYGMKVNQDTIDSMLKIDTAGELSSVDSLLTNIHSVLGAISASVAHIESNTARSTSDKFDMTMNDIIDLRNGINNSRLTSGVESIFDPLNVSEYKSKEVLQIADASVLAFKDLSQDIFKTSMALGEVPVNDLETVLSLFKTALSHVNDAMKQVELYESRTGDSVHDGSDYATNVLSEHYSELLDSTNIQALLYMLSQAKLDIAEFKDVHDGGLYGSADDGIDNIGLVVGGLQQIHSILESIYGVLHGFTGIESDAKNSVKYSKPTNEVAATTRGLSDQDISVLNSILQSVQDINAYLHTDNGDDITEKPKGDNQDQLEQSSIYQLLASKLSGNIASDDTLSSVRDLLTQLVSIATAKDETPDDDNTQVKESLGQLVTTLTSAVKGLQDVASGITQQQNARKTDTSVANARIANKNDYAQIKDVALNSLGDRAIDSEVTEMKALANGIVQVIGYLQVAENEWEGFTLQVNEANEVSKLAFDKNSKAAKRAAAEAEALRKLSEQSSDENKKTYSREETAARAQAHLDEYTAQGKNATVQLKDSGRYTISILEEIGGLSKQIFQTFDENDDKIERTTATMSNKVLVKLQDLQNIAEFGRTGGFISDGDDVYKKYKEASAELGRLNTLYRDQDGLTDEAIASWNTQIKLVQKLGTEVEKLVFTRKTASTNGLFASQKNASVNTFDREYAQLKESIAIPDSFVDEVNAARNALGGAIDTTSLKIAQNNWIALKEKIKETAIEHDLYIKKTSSSQTTKQSSYGTTPVANAQKRFRELNVRAQSYIDDGSTVVYDALQKYKKAYEDLIALQKTFNGRSEKDLSSEQIEQFERLKVKCEGYGKSLKKIIDSSDKLHTNGINSKDIMDDVPLGNYDDRVKALKDYVAETYGARADIKGFNGDATELFFTLKRGDGTIDSMTASLNAARTAIVSTSKGTKQTTSIFGELWNRMKGLGKYAAARFGVDELFQAIRIGVQYVREIDSALTELKKVTDETDATYSRFLQNMSKTADVVGSTVKDLTTMAAEWSRLGYSLEESAELAKNTAILMNVSEFNDATEASEALISTMQAFQYTADESGHVVDILNEIGNSYAVSSDGLAIALQDSASALMEGGNSLEQSVALIAASNKVLQDPNSVGSALRTISLRLRGTSVEILEEMGESTDGVVESTSKLQEKLKALTGVDILTNTGAYKDTYTILKEIGAVWQDLDNLDKSAALELMAGKNRANALSAILNNMSDLEGAYESALNANGSALRENETYLDSIEGKIAKFNNAVQTMWMNFLNDDAVKWIVDLGTAAIKLVDTLGLIPTAAAGLSAIKTFSVSAEDSLSTLKKGLNSLITDLGKGGFKNFSSAVSSTAGSLLGSLGKGLLTGGLAAVVTIGLGHVITAFDNWAHKTEKAIERANEALNKYTAKQEELEDQKTTVDELSAAYTRLSSGVNTLTNDNIGLTVESYEEYLDVCNEIADMYPELVAGYDAQGNAILNLRGKVEGLTDAYKEAQLAAANELLTDKNKKDIWTEYENTAGKVIAAKYINANDHTKNYDFDVTQQDRINALEAILSMSGDDFAQFYEYDKTGNMAQWDLLREQLKKMGTYVDDPLMKQSFNSFFASNFDSLGAYRSDLNSMLTQLNQDVYNGMSGIRSTIAASLLFDENYLKLDADPAAQGLVDALLKSLDLEFVVQSGAENINDLISYFSTEVVAKVGSDSNLYKNLTSVSNDLAKAMAGGDGEAYQEAKSEWLALVADMSRDASGNIQIDPNADVVTQYLQQLVQDIENQSKNYEVQLQMQMDFDSEANIADVAERVGKKLESEYSPDHTVKDTYGMLSVLSNDDDGVLRADDLKERYEEYVKNSEDISSKVNWRDQDLSVDGWTAEQVNAIDALCEIMELYGIDIDTATSKLIELGYVAQLLDDIPSFNLASESTNELVDKFQSDIDSIKSAWDSLNSDEMTKSDFVDLAQEFPELMEGVDLSDDNWMVKARENLEELNNTKINDFVAELEKMKEAMIARGDEQSMIDMVDSFINYAKEARNLNDVVNAQSEYYNLVRDLGVEVRSYMNIVDVNEANTASILKQIEAVKESINQYELLEDTLLGTVSAFDKFAKAQEADSKNTYGESYVAMAQTMYDAIYKTGQVGSEQFWAAVRANVPDDIYAHLTPGKEQIQAISEYLNSNVFSALTFNEETFSIDYSDIKNFVEKAQDVGVFTGTDTGAFGLSAEFMNSLKEDEDALQAFADKMGVTTTQIYTMLSEIDKYNADGIGLSMLLQLDNSTAGQITLVTNELERLFVQRKALLEQGADNETLKVNEGEIAAAESQMVALQRQATDVVASYAMIDKALADTSKKVSEVLPEHMYTEIGLSGDKTVQEQIQTIKDYLLGLEEPTVVELNIAKQAIEDIENLDPTITAHVDINDDGLYEVINADQYVGEIDLQHYVDLKNAESFIDASLAEGLTTTENLLTQIAENTAIMAGKDDSNSTTKNSENKKTTSPKSTKEIDEESVELSFKTSKDLYTLHDAIIKERAMLASSGLMTMEQQTTYDKLDSLRKEVFGLFNDLDNGNILVENAVPKLSELLSEAAKLGVEVPVVFDTPEEPVEVTATVNASLDPNASQEIDQAATKIGELSTSNALFASVEQYAEDINFVSSEISTLQEAFEKLESGQFTIVDFMELTKEFPELAKGVDLSSKEFKGLGQNLKRAMRSSPDKLVDELKELKEQMAATGESTDYLDQLITSIENMPKDAVQNLSDEYGELTDVIIRAKQAQTDLQTAMSENPNAGFETRSDAIEQMKQLMSTDKIGSESELWDIAAEFGFTYDSAKTINENADALYNYIKARESWYATDEDGNHTYDGTKSFMEDVEQATQSADWENILKKHGLAPEDFQWSFDGKNFEMDFDNENFDAIVAALSEMPQLTGLTSEEFADLLTQIGQFYDIDWQNIEDVSSYISAIANSSDTASEKVDKMTDSVEAYLKNELSEEEFAKLDFDNLDEAAISALECNESIKELLKTYLSLKQSLTDPLKINIEGTTTSDVTSALDQLGIDYQVVKDEITRNPIAVNIVSATDLITELTNKGWTKEQISTYLQQLTSTENGLGITIEGKVNMNKQEIDDAITAAGNIPETESVTLNVQGTGAKTLSDALDDANALNGKRVTTYIDTHKTTYVSTVQRSDSVNGTAHAHGTAYKSGSWGAPASTEALVGELGPELRVRGSEWTLIGQNGAEFTDIQKGDIVFNHKQTESLLKNGYVTGRGKAYAAGTAFASGSGTYSDGKYNFSDTSTSSSKKTSAAKTASKSSKEVSNDFKEIFDWIEVRLEEITEAIDLSTAKLDNAIGYAKQNDFVNEIIGLNRDLYDNLTAGATEYYAFSEELLKKIPAEYRAAAQDGSIAIQDFTGKVGETTLDAIQDYREWVQKGADLTQQAEEVLTEISSLAKQAIDNIATDYENKRSIKDSKIEQYEAYNALLETDLGFESAKIYQAMIAENDKNIVTLQEQRNKMQAELDEQVKAGNIQKGSQDWYDAVNDIAAVDTEIINLKTDTEDFQDAINELHWEHFELFESKIEAIADEADNLIDILSNADVVNEVGEWTKEGITSLGLYAQQMEIAEVQAKEYQEEIDYLNKNWQKLGYTEQEYLDKLEELKSAQYDSIQAYYDTKDAIVDLNAERVEVIKEGIEKEIDAYSELIEKKKEALDAEKDLYDFQKSVKEQEKDIADIQRQLAALASDNSASARAKRAQLEAELLEAQAELEDSYYERSISNQQEALDKELENFEETKNKEIEGWEEYLENTEQVVADSLATVQANTDVVYETLQQLGSEYSLSITEALTSPWKDGESAIQDYTEMFKLSMSSTVEELKALEAEFNEITSRVEASGASSVNTVNTNATNYQAAEKITPPAADNSNSNSSSSTSSNNTSTSTVKSYPYGKASATSGNIKKGSKGNAVKAIQYALNELGYGNSGTQKVDGIFGSQTKTAVKKFQKAMGISADGIVGKNTRAKFKAKGYKVGTTGVDYDQWAWIDELGEELIIRPQNGRLTFMEKGTGVVPADLTSNLMSWGAIDPQDMLDRNRPSIGVSPSVVNNTMEINVDASVGTLLSVENFNGDDPAEVAKLVNKALEKHTKNLNNSLKKFTR